MDIDRIKGAAQQAAGSVKSTVGQVLGDGKLQVDGEALKTEGKVNSAIGGIKDTAREAADKLAGKAT